MKICSALLALSALAFSSTALHADAISDGFSFDLTAGSSSIPLLVITTPILNGTQYAFTTIDTSIGGGSLLSNTTNVFTATYINTAVGVGVFQFTDLCTQVTLLGSAAPACRAFALSYTNIALPGASLVTALGASVDIAASLATFGTDLIPDNPQFPIIGVEIGLGNGQIDFTNPGNPGNPGPIPEPGTLGLMATGLMGAAGMIRRRIVTSRS